MSFFRKLLYQYRLLFESPYNQQHKVSAILRFFYWNFCKKLNINFEAKVWGIKFKFWVDSHQSYWLYKNYIMDWVEFNLIQKISREEDVIVDIGANIGVYSFWFSKCINDKGRIFSFEPDRKNLERFKYGFSLNHISSLSIHDIAISDKNGEAKFFSGLDEQSSLFYESEKSAQQFTTVKTQTLDDFCKQNNLATINFLKIDVEGAEWFVLKGASELLQNKSIKIIQLELNNHINKFNLKIDDVVDMMSNYQYELYRLEEYFVKIDIHTINLLEEENNNYYFINDMGYVQSRIDGN